MPTAHPNYFQNLRERLMGSLRRLLETGEFADFTIICGDRKWRVHKVVLYEVDYFRCAIEGGFKVSSSSLYGCQNDWSIN